MIDNRHVPRIGKYGNVLCVFEKNKEGEMGRAGEHSYYKVRCQKRVLPTQKVAKNALSKYNRKKVYVKMQMQFMNGIGLGPTWVEKTGIEITSVYLMSSANFLEICLILIYDLEFCSPS